MQAKGRAFSQAQAALHPQGRGNGNRGRRHHQVGESLHQGPLGTIAGPQAQGIGAGQGGGIHHQAGAIQPDTRGQRASISTVEAEAQRIAVGIQHPALADQIPAGRRGLAEQQGLGQVPERRQVALADRDLEVERHRRGGVALTGQQREGMATHRLEGQRTQAQLCSCRIEANAGRRHAALGQAEAEVGAIGIDGEVAQIDHLEVVRAARPGLEAEPQLILLTRHAARCIGQVAHHQAQGRAVLAAAIAVVEAEGEGSLVIEARSQLPGVDYPARAAAAQRQAGPAQRHRFGTAAQHANALKRCATAIGGPRGGDQAEVRQAEQPGAEAGVRLAAVAQGLQPQTQGCGLVAITEGAEGVSMAEVFEQQQAAAFLEGQSACRRG